MGLLHERRVRAAGVGLLCAVAATMAVWSGPLASVTAAFHGSTGTTASVPAHAASHAVK